jgi:hypothetical protein
MRAIHQGFEVSTPTVLRMQTFPVSTQRRKDALVPYYLPILEEIQVDGASFQVN